MKTLIYTVLGLVLLAHRALSAPSERDQSGQSGEGGEEGDYEEGDILTPPESEGSKYSMAEHSFYKWPNNIVYFKWESNIGSAKKSVVQEAMANVEEALRNDDGSLCIDFKKKQSDDLYYIYVQASTGCAAGIGRWPNYITPMYISSSCSVGNMMHELLHTLGLFHEQSRTDRDQYVTINTQNIRSGYESNFDIASGIYDVDTRYDYGSIMHYSATSFTANGSPTISVPNGETIGQRTALSDCDVERIQVHYGCKDKAVLCAKT